MLVFNKASANDPCGLWHWCLCNKIRFVRSNASLEASKQKHAEAMERLKLVEKLIAKQKVDPIAARCAVEGWIEESPLVCLALIKKPVQSMISEEETE